MKKTNPSYGIATTFLGLIICAMSLLVSMPAKAQWSHKEGDPAPDVIESHLVQPFTKAEWEASNFASDKEVQWFRDAKYGMLLQFGDLQQNSWVRFGSGELPSV